LIEVPDISSFIVCLFISKFEIRNIDDLEGVLFSGNVKIKLEGRVQCVSFNLQVVVEVISQILILIHTLILIEFEE
jgi:hypothetical protein